MHEIFADLGGFIRLARCRPNFLIRVVDSDSEAGGMDFRCFGVDVHGNEKPLDHGLGLDVVAICVSGLLATHQHVGAQRVNPIAPQDDRRVDQERLMPPHRVHCQSA